MPLTQSVIDSVPVPPPARVALSDGDNLYLVFEKRGRPGWLLKYRFAGVPTSVSFGRYPDVGLADARKAADAARAQLRSGVNPSTAKRVEKDAAYVAAANTFGKAGRELIERDDTKAQRTADKHEWLFGLLSALHSRPLTGITAPDVLKVLRGIEVSGKREAARRCAQFTARVFRLAIQEGYCTLNPASDLRGALKPVKTKSHAAIVDEKHFGNLMQLVDSDQFSHATVRHGLQLLARVALRPGELRAGEWKEVDFDKAEWRIPAARMKMRREFLVPLSRQAIEILKRQQEVSGDGTYIFPGVRSGRPMSDAGMGVSLKNMFIPAESHVPHGFRSSFSTIMREHGRDGEVIELQLSHAKKDKIAGIYDRSQRNAERRVLLQDWADLIDTLKKAEA
jgi:integrase